MILVGDVPFLNGFMMGKNRVHHRLIALLIPCALLVLLTEGRAQSNQPHPEGNVRTIYGAPVGAVDEEGVVYNAYGSKLGRVDVNGNVYNVSDIFIGKIYPNGDILNQAGIFIGYAEPDGSIYNVSDVKIGSVQTGGDLILSGGAARIIFFRGSNTLRIPVPEPHRRHRP